MEPANGACGATLKPSRPLLQKRTAMEPAMAACSFLLEMPLPAMAAPPPLENWMMTGEFTSCRQAGGVGRSALLHGHAPHAPVEPC